MSTAVAYSPRHFVLPGPFADYECINNPSSDFEEHIASITPMLRKKAGDFLRQIRGRERAHYDLDDLLQEFVIVLMEKYRYYDPQKSRFTTWSTIIIHQHLAEIRNRCHVVNAPRDAAAQLADPDIGEAKLELIRRSLRDFHSVDDQGELAGGREDPTGDEVEAADLHAVDRQLLREAIDSLANPTWIFVVSTTFGLGGAPPLACAAQAKALKITIARVIYIRQEALRAIRCTLESRRHPV